MDDILYKVTGCLLNSAIPDDLPDDLQLFTSHATSPAM